MCACACEFVHDFLCLFFFKQKTAYEIGVRLVGSEMCIRDRCVCVCVCAWSTPSSNDVVTDDAVLTVQCEYTHIQIFSYMCFMFMSTRVDSVSCCGPMCAHVTLLYVFIYSNTLLMFDGINVACGITAVGHVTCTA